MASEGFFSQSDDVVKGTARLLHEVEDNIVDLLRCDDLDELDRKLLFAEIMWKLGVVMDHCHYALYHNIQNKREHSHWQAGKNIKTPYSEKLKWSADRIRDQQLKRKTFVTDHCKTIFGEHYQTDEGIPDSYLKDFQENALSLQAMIEVDKAGVPVKICQQHEYQQHSVQQCDCRNKVLSLVRAQKYEYKTPGDQRRFTPSRIHFENLESVRMPVIHWSETTLFNLLHYFRNGTTHRYFISLHRKGCPPHGETLWISVPEITGLRDENNTQSYHEHRLSLVLGRLFYFVTDQRQKLLSIEDDEFACGGFIFLAMSLVPRPLHLMPIPLG